MENAPPRWAYATLACTSVVTLIVWFIQAPAQRYVIVNFWILFAAVFAWGVQKQRGGWSWKASLIGLGLVLPLTAFVLLFYLDISGEYELRVLMVLSFAALWIVVFGLLRVADPRLLALLCILPALFQYGECSARYLLSEQYADLGSMLWINVSQLPRRVPPTTVLRRTRSGLEIYEGWKLTFETPLPNTPYFNPFLQLRTTRMKDGFRNSAPVNSAACGKEIYTANTR